MSLPSGYRQVEYIQSSGTQYVNTAVNPNQNTRVVLDAQYATTNSTTVFYFGARDGDNVSEFQLRIRNNSAAFLSEYGNDRSGISYTADYTQRLTIDFNKNAVRVGTATGTHSTATFQCNCPIYLFALDTANVPDDFAKALRIYSCQIYDNGALVRDYIPCLNPSGVAGLYDLVNGVFYGNAGTGTFAAGHRVYDANEITKLEYIESSGTQYVDTEFKADQNTSVFVDIALKNTDTQTVFGARTTSASKAFAVNWVTSVHYRLHYNDGYTNFSKGISDPTVRHLIACEKNTLTINGVSVNRTYAAFECDYNLLLLALNHAGTAQQFAFAKIYSCQIYDNGTLVRDYYPATVDGQVGLWDAISGSLYTDASGGAFTAGPGIYIATPTNFEQILAVFLRWSAVDCDGYNIYRDGVLLGTTTDTHYIDLTADENERYTYTLTAYRGSAESDPATLEVYTRSGYFVLKPVIESAFFQ